MNLYIHIFAGEYRLRSGCFPNSRLQLSIEFHTMAVLWIFHVHVEVENYRVESESSTKASTRSATSSLTDIHRQNRFDSIPIGVLPSKLPLCDLDNGLIAPRLYRRTDSA